MERADRVRKEAADEAEGAKASVEAAQTRKRRAEKRIVASSIRYVLVVGPGIRGGYAGGPSDGRCLSRFASRFAASSCFQFSGFFK